MSGWFPAGSSSLDGFRFDSNRPPRASHVTSQPPNPPLNHPPHPPRTIDWPLPNRWSRDPVRSLIGPLSGVHLIKKKGIKDGDIKEGARVKRERERERERETTFVEKWRQRGGQHC